MKSSITHSFFVILGLFFSLFFDSFTIQAQTKENPKKEKLTLSKPGKAALLSALIPGAGQIYNKKYWKVPIIYGAAVTSAIVINFNHKRYVQFRNNLAYATDNNPNTLVEEKYSSVSEDGLKRTRDFYRRNRDFTIIISGLLYGLNIVDAVVDAHLLEFSVTDELTAKIQPKLLQNNNKVVAGIGLRFSF